MDAIWKQSSTKTKEVIAAELSKKESVLNNNNFGKFISTNCSLSLFKRAREDWNKLQKVDNKKKELFSDILEPKKRKEPVKDEEEEDKTVSSSSSPPKKKKKKAAKSYLDDL